MNIEKIMFAFIRSVVFESEIDEKELEEIKNSLDEEVLSRLYKLSKAHDVANIVGAGLEKHGLLSESETAKKLYKEKFLAAFRCEKLIRELEKLMLTLDESEIDHIALKGSVIRDLYPEAWMRTSCDIDILVREHDLDRAISAISEKLNYRVAERKGYHDISLYSPSGIHLELHFNINENMEKIDKVLSCAWEHAVLNEGKNHEYKFTDEYLYFHVLAHASYHFVHGGCGVRSFIDMKLIKQKLTVEAEILSDLLGKSDLSTFEIACDEMCRVWFDKAEYTDLASNMEKYVISGGVYGNASNMITSVRKKGKLAYIMSRIFMSYDLLKIEYPILVDHKILFPACQVARWFRVFDKDKAKRMNDEIKLNNSISDDKVNQTQAMLKDLGLD